MRITLTEAARATLAEAAPDKPLNNAITALGYAPDGSTLAVGMRDPNLVLLLDSRTLAVRGRLEGHLAMVARVAFAPDGQTLASSGHDGTVRLWDVVTKRQRLLLDQFQGNVRGLAISPDGRRIFAGEFVPGNKGSAQAWSAQDGKLLGSLANHARGIEDIAVSPDGLTLATSSRDQTVRLWDLATYTQKNVFDAKGPWANGLAFTPDGKSLIAVFNDKTIRLFDATTMRPKYQIKTTARSFINLAVARNNSLLATADDDRIQLWNPADGAPLASFPDAGGTITAIRFAPDSQSVAVGGLSGFIRVFRLDRDSK